VSYRIDQFFKYTNFPVLILERQSYQDFMKLFIAFNAVFYAIIIFMIFAARQLYLSLK